MFREFMGQIPKELVNFLLTTLFSLLIGLEQRRKHNQQQESHSFGTDRTFTLIGILGYVLYMLDTKSLLPFMTGFVVLFLFLGIYYFKKISFYNRFGITAIITALITYCMAPLVATQPQYLVLLVVICLLVITEIKENLSEITLKFDNTEFITLAKFLALAGVILPLLPNKPIGYGFAISPYLFWLSIVVVSAISYFSYLLQKFVFPHSGLLLTGLLGGLYSSTATTIIISRKSKEAVGSPRIVPAIMLAIAMMYLRIFILAMVFNYEIATIILPYFAILLATSLLLAFLMLRFHHQITKKVPPPEETHGVQRNPLEFKTALVFGLLFVGFTIITHYVLKAYGETGLRTVAVIVGVTDIDPFILNLLQGHWEIDHRTLGTAILLAINSNNIAKMAYALVLSDKDQRKPIIVSFGVLLIAGFLLSLLRPF